VLILVTLTPTMNIDCKRHPPFDPRLQKDDSDTVGDSFQGPRLRPRARLHHAKSQHDSWFSRIVCKKCIFCVELCVFAIWFEGAFQFDCLSVSKLWEHMHNYPIALSNCNILYITIVFWWSLWRCLTFTVLEITVRIVFYPDLNRSKWSIVS